MSNFFEPGRPLYLFKTTFFYSYKTSIQICSCHAFPKCYFRESKQFDRESYNW